MEFGPTGEYTDSVFLSTMSGDGSSFWVSDFFTFFFLGLGTFGYSFFSFFFFATTFTFSTGYSLGVDLTLFLTLVCASEGNLWANFFRLAKVDMPNFNYKLKASIAFFDSSTNYYFFICLAELYIEVFLYLLRRSG